MEGTMGWKRVYNLQSAYNVRRWMLTQEGLDAAVRLRIEEHLSRIEKELQAAGTAGPRTAFNGASMRPFGA